MSTISDIQNTPQSGLVHIDALIDALPDWNFLTPAQTTLVYTFSIATGNEEGATPAAFNEAQQAAAEAILQHVTAVTGITFQETNDGAAADIHFSRDDIADPNVAGLCSMISRFSFDETDEILESSAQAWVYLDDAEWNTQNLSPAAGNSGYEVLLHEIGHMLGLKHPFEGSPTLPAGQDNTSNTVMSYTHQGGPYSTFREYDIAALNFLYGGDGLRGAWGVGTSGEFLTGTSGNDAITVGTAFTTHKITTGAGSDTLIYGGNRSDFVIAGTNDGQFLRVTGLDWDDLVARDVETLQFSDGSFAVADFFGTTHRWSTLANGQTIGVFNPDSDALRFDRLLISAADVNVAAGSIVFGYGGKTVTVAMDLAAATTGNVRFDNGSLLLIGDNSSATVNDDAANTLNGAAGRDRLMGLGGDDRLFGSANRDKLFGGAGNDTLNGGVGLDTLSGGAGDDFYVVTDTGDAVVEGADGGGIDTVQSAVDYSLGAVIEHLTLTGAAVNGTGNGSDNTIIGNAQANVLMGLLGNDSLTGGAGNDILNGAGGNDTLAGGAGDDLYRLDLASDVVVELPGAGVDTVEIRLNYALGANLENLTFTGAGNVNGNGNALGNAITGNAANNKLVGNAGDDTLDGGGGTDSLIGGAGNDTYITDGGDTIQEGAGAGGIDTVRSAVDHSLGTVFEHLVLTGTAVNGFGNASANRLTGNAQANALTGAGGNDTIDGGGGADTLTGGAGNDRFVFVAGQADGDSVLNFAGNGAAVGDDILVTGYTGVTVINSSPVTTLQLAYSGGTDIVTFANATIHQSDIVFG